jgi:hypothetical protein
LPVFPYGTLGRGYILESEQAYETLRRRLKAYIFIMLVLVIGASALHRYATAVVLGLLCSAFYELWTRFLRRGLQQSDEKLSLEESMTSQAVRHSAVTLWLFEIGALVFVGFGILFLVMASADHRDWLMVLASTIFFGICAVVSGCMLVLRRRSRAANVQSVQ